MAEEIYGFDESKSKVTLKSGAGITVGEDGTIGHTNEMEASASYVGGTTAVPMIKIDEQGHVVALTKQTIYPPTSAGSKGQVWASDGAGAGAWTNVVGIFNNVSASSWVADTTYADYGYKCTIALTGVTADDVAEVIFGVTEATSGDYAPICETYAGGVYLYSKVNTAITVPTIMVMKGVVG